MKNFILSVFVIIMVLSLCACSNMLKKEYLALETLTSEGDNSSSDGLSNISSYNQLKNSLRLIVEAHEETGKLKFLDYEGEIQSDLAQAISELIGTDLIAAFSVDYISTELSRIVSYYEATVYVNYKKTAEEVENIVYLPSIESVKGKVTLALNKFTKNYAFQLTNRNLSEELILKEIKDAYYTNPVTCISLPKVEISLYPATGISRIVELNFNYDPEPELLEIAKGQVQNAIDAIGETITRENKLDEIISLFTSLINSCTFDKNNAKRVLSEFEPLYGSTVYGGLCEGLADSLGMALSYNALCRDNSINCVLVEGMLNKEVHYWNIVEYEGNFYHVDSASATTAGLKNTFMETDKLMQDLGYWWNIEDYPECINTLEIEY